MQIAMAEFNAFALPMDVDAYFVQRRRSHALGSWHMERWVVKNTRFEINDRRPIDITQEVQNS